MECDTATAWQEQSKPGLDCELISYGLKTSLTHYLIGALCKHMAHEGRHAFALPNCLSPPICLSLDLHVWLHSDPSSIS